MPTLRILADGRSVYATPGQSGLDGVPVFAVGSSEVAKVTLDYTAWLLGEAVTDSAWTVNGATLGAESITDGVAAVLVNAPASAALLGYGAEAESIGCLSVTLGHTIIAADGRVKRTALRLAVQPAVVAPMLVSDVGVYA